MRVSDALATVATVVFGGVAGFLVAGLAGAAVLGLLGLAVGVLAARANVRPGITSTVFVGAMTGVLVGASIVETICLPGTCPAAELTGGAVLGIASFFGVGLVAALVTRSFDEYNEHVEAGTPPPTPGCESDAGPVGGDQPE